MKKMDVILSNASFNLCQSSTATVTGAQCMQSMYIPSKSKMQMPIYNTAAGVSLVQKCKQIPTDPMHLPTFTLSRHDQQMHR